MSDQAKLFINGKEFAVHPVRIEPTVQSSEEIRVSVDLSKPIELAFTLNIDQVLWMRFIALYWWHKYHQTLN